MRALLGLLLATIAGCATTAPSRDGIVVVLWSDGVLGTDFDRVEMSVNGIAVDTSKLDALPTSLAIEGKAGSEILVEARAIKDNLLRIAVAKRTTVPSGHASVLDVSLGLDCYDRCTQAPPNGTLLAWCDPGAPPGAPSCTPPPLVAVETLPMYAPDQDPIAPFKTKPRGCMSKPFCTSTSTCADVFGVGSTGMLSCNASCRALDDARSTCDLGLASSPWPMSSGSAPGHRRSTQTGPLTSDDPKVISLAMVALGPKNTPVVSADGSVAFVPTVNGVARIDLATNQASLLPLPDPGTLAQLPKCCEVRSSPVLTKNGTLLAMTPTGILLSWSLPWNTPPAAKYLFKDNTAIDPCDGCTNGHVVITPDGQGYVGTNKGLVGLDIGQRLVKWGPINDCYTDAAVPAVASDGRIYVGRAPKDGICVVTPDGRARAYQGEDGVFGSVEGVSVGIDGTAFFGTSNYVLHSKSDTSSWNVLVDGPVLSAPALGVDGTVYATTSFPNPAIHAVDRFGRRKWSYPLRGGTDTFGSPIVAADGTIYVVNSGGFALALAPNGTKRWERGSGDRFFGSAVLLPNKRMIAVHADRLDVFAEGS